MRVGGTAIRCDSNETVCSALLAQATEAREKGREWGRQEVAKETVLEIGGGGGKWSLRKGKDGIDHGEVIIFGF